MKTFKFAKMATAAIPLILLCLLLTAAPVHAVGTAAGTLISNTASIAYQDAGTNNYTATSNTVDVTVSSVFTVSVNCAAAQNSNSNTTTYYACTLTNTGNASNTFALSALSAPVWTTALLADDGFGGGANIPNNGIHEAGETTVTATTGALAADATYMFFMAVTVPAGTPNGTTSITTLAVVGSADGTAVDDTTVPRTTTAQAPALTVAKKVRNVTTAGAFAAVGVTAKPAEILEYQVLVTNAGTVQATSVVLSDILNANVTYVAGSLYVGSNIVFNGAGNTNKSDAAAGDAGCGVDACGAANYAAGSKTVTFYLGNTATEIAGGTLGLASTVYAYYRVTVN
jgi:uncharacterized repeat protein (TIGR01451 family)